MRAGVKMNDKKYSWLDNHSHRELKEMLIKAWKENERLRSSASSPSSEVKQT